MTKKHFIKLAAGFKKANDNARSYAERDAISTCVKIVADVCAEVNERFDRDTFYAAIYGVE